MDVVVVFIHSSFCKISYRKIVIKTSDSIHHHLSIAKRNDQSVPVVIASISRTVLGIPREKLSNPSLAINRLFLRQRWKEGREGKDVLVLDSNSADVFVLIQKLSIEMW